MNSDRKISSDPAVKASCAEVARKIALHIAAEGTQASGIAGLSLYRRSAPTSCVCTTYEPRLTVFAQGQKRIHLGSDTYVCSDATFLLTAVDLPVVSQVIQATTERPILGLLFQLDMAEIRNILSEQELPDREDPSSARAMVVGSCSAPFLDACSRLLDLLATPEEMPFLSKLILREIVYRLLRSPQGSHLRAIATVGEQGQRTAKAVSWLRQNYAKPLRVEHLASIARMGVSTLHHHFRSLTSMSPLQYQKQLRLQAARERMLNEGLDAASAAFEVGYESASQFNREYSRFFGQPPMRDVRSHRSSSPEAARE